MKKYLSILSAIIAAAMVTTTVSAQSTEGFVKVVSLRGGARTMPDGKAIKVGQILKPGVIIQTAADSYVDLVLNNARATQGVGSAMSDDSLESISTSSSGYKPKAVQDAIRVFENTVVSVDKLVITKTGADILTTFVPMEMGEIEKLMREEGMLQRYPKDNN